MWGSTERKILVLRPSLRRPEEEALAEVDWVVGYSWRHSVVALMMDWVWIGLPSKRISVLFMQVHTRYEKIKLKSEDRA